MSALKLNMKKVFLFITILFLFMQTLVLSAFAEGEPVKVMSLKYDNFSSLICISTKDANGTFYAMPNKYVRLEKPNRIYFDIENSVLVGAKQQLVFDKSVIKEIRLAQFSTNPNIVRTVITFEEDFDTSKIKLLSLDGNLIVKISDLVINNDYFNTIYTEKDEIQDYSNISVTSQAVQKVAIPVSQTAKTTDNVMDDIHKAFANSTLNNTEGTTYDSVISVDLSSALKLRTKYFINQYIPKNNGLLVSGMGQITAAKIFYLTAPKRAVIDLPNTYLDKKVRNKEVSLCPDGSCKDIAKIGQFEYNKARIVITSENAEKYIPVYSSDSESLFLINSEKLNHTSLVANVSNITKAYVKKIDSKTSELILSFTTPIVHSIVRSNDALNLYLFNVKSYNAQEITKILSGSGFKNLNFTLLPQVGVKACMQGILKDDVIAIAQSADGKALRIRITKAHEEEIIKQEKPLIKRGKTKNKVVLDAGHGGSDYGAIREGVNEKDITLDVTRRVESILRSKGYKTALTRTDDTYVSLEDRVAISEKEEPEIFVSIHVNSAVSTEPNGIETHYYHDYSKDLADTVHKNLIKNISSKDRGLFKSKFYVINHTTDPAILVEIGFLSNENERQDLITDGRKQKTAKAIADGIIEYLKKK